MNKNMNIKVKGFRGLWTIIDTTFFKGEKWALLEHSTYGDETSYLVISLMGNCFSDEHTTKKGTPYVEYTGTPLCETYDDIYTGLEDYFA